MPESTPAAPPAPTLHIYERDILPDERSSLSVLSTHIAPGARVLDLGCGSGAIGRYLARRDGPAVGPIDGLTLSHDEAALAAPHYRRVEVADLDLARLTDLFEPGSYDTIVCADVLEHTRQPERVLQQCRQLLSPGGRVLLSIPNAGYVGLVAELMAGEFRYRPEGLLDATHLRFFTRRSLLRFLAEQRWQLEQVEHITRQLPDSEFNIAFDALPPAVARHLLALPDALTYQFIITARPAAQDEAIAQPTLEPQLPAQALFTAELYLDSGTGFDEAHKLTARGIVGQAHQTLGFALPANTRLHALKLDPADRPGFVHLHQLKLLDSSRQTLWHWQASEAQASDTLLATTYDGLHLQPGAWPGSPFLLLLHGTDPWMTLPIPADTLALATGGCLEVELGWPMSADYLALAGLTQRGISQARLQAERDIQQAQAAAQVAEQKNTELLITVNQHQQLDQQNQHLRQQKSDLLVQINTLSQERDQALQLVHDIEHSTVFRATRPIVNVKMRIDRLLGIGSTRPRPDPAQQRAAQARPIDTPPHPVDIIVPIYKGLDDTRRCVESVLAAACDTPWCLILINDASPEPALTDWLRHIAGTDARITLLENPDNLGFVGTVNRGMALSDAHDVLLLNSDTEVAPGWLDRLRAAAHSDQRVASVTPFSNNATICSYPRFCQDNALPTGWDTAALDALFARVNAGQTVDVPTGVGFCMYIRRAALDAIGLFDVENFGKGYGEENDFCIRAASAGWRNLHALDVFVRHFGGVSFGAAKGPRERAAMHTLRRLHPHYESEVLRFVQADPARPARLAADLARITHGARPCVLAILHDRAGGTERQVRELAELLHERVQFLLLRPAPGQRLSLQLPGPDEGFELQFQLGQDENALLGLLRQLPVRHIHIHHLLGHGRFVLQLPQRLGVSFDITLHDYYLPFGNISLTDASGSYSPDAASERSDCSDNNSPLPTGFDRPGWYQRCLQLLHQARHVIAPSRDALARLARIAPGAPLRLVPHTDIDPAQPLPTPQPRPLDTHQPLKIAVIGALSPIKGADLLEEAALAARKQNLPIEFHLIGYGYRALKTQPQARLTVHGRYDEAELPALLNWLQPDLVWFPARWPETYCYTLSACLLGGWPVAAPNIGALPERLLQRPWSWVCPWDWSAAQWLAFFADIRDQHFATGHPPKPTTELPALDASQVATDAITPQPPTWYTNTYLAELPAPDPSHPGPAPDSLLAHLPPSDASQAGPRASTLRLLTRLRALPVLAPVARAIPPHWQTRVKSWLRR